MAPPLWAARGEEVTLSGVRCRSCTTTFFPPQDYGCEHCGASGDHLEPCDLSTSGRILGFARVSKHHRVETPFQIAEVALDAGPLVRGRLEHEAPAVGQRVVGATRPLHDGVGLVFVPGAERS